MILSRVGKVDGIQQNGVDQAEDGCICADAKRQDSLCRDRKSGTLAKDAKGLHNLREKVGHIEPRRCNQASSAVRKVNQALSAAP